MSNEINYQNNPLNGVGLKQLLTEIVDYYGFPILFAYLNINCFKNNPSIEASLKFLKKTEWAREKVEVFYLYQFKSLPRPSSTQFKLAPRARIVPDGQVPGEPAPLSLEDAEQFRAKQQAKAAEYQSSKRGEHHSTVRGKNSFNKSSSRNNSKPYKAPSQSASNNDDPWASWKE